MTLWESIVTPLFLARTKRLRGHGTPNASTVPGGKQQWHRSYHDVLNTIIHRNAQDIHMHGIPNTYSCGG